MTQESITYILPDLPWEILLDTIVRDAPPGAILEVHTEPMRALVERRLAESGRTDLALRLVEQGTTGSRW